MTLDRIHGGTRNRNEIAGIIFIQNSVGQNVVLRYQYSVNAIDQRTDVVDTGTGAPTFRHFGYDSGGELLGDHRYHGSNPADTSSPDNGWIYGFNYDPIGNRTSSASVGSGSINYTSNTLNQYTQISNASAQAFDDDGNQVTDGINIYAWDAENHLTCVINALSDVRVNYEYDFMGRRVRKTVTNGGSMTSDQLYLYDGWNVVAEYDAGNTALPIRTWTWGLDVSGGPEEIGGIGGLLFSKECSGSVTGVYSFTYDGSGNVSEMLDQNGSIAAHNEYDPFGKPLIETGPMAALSPVRFSTKLTDDETGLVYYGNRYYNPNTGSWISRDPLGERGGINLYGYVLNSPINLIDPFGLDNLNLAAPGSDDAIGIDARGTSSSYYSVGGHGIERDDGTVSGIRDSRDPSNPKALSPQALANLIKQQPDYDPKKPVKLNSCSTGKGGDNSYAKQLAKALNNTVIAPTDVLDTETLCNSYSRKLAYK